MIKIDNQTQQDSAVYTRLGGHLFDVLNYCGIKIHPLAITLGYTFLVYQYLDWVQQTGFNQKTGNLLIVSFIYKLLKQFNKWNIRSRKDQMSKIKLPYFERILQPLGLFYLYSCMLQFSVRYELQIQFYAILFATVAPQIMKIIQSQESSNILFLIFQKLKGKYLIITQIYLLIFTLKPILKRVYFIHYRLPYCGVLIAAIFVALAALLYLYQYFIIKNKTKTITNPTLVFLLAIIYPGWVHMVLSYNLDTMLATRFIHQKWVCLSFGYFLAKTGIKDRYFSHIELSFTYAFFTYVLELVIFYVFPVENMVFRIILAYVNIFIVFGPSLALLFRKIYQSVPVNLSDLVVLNQKTRAPN